MVNVSPIRTEADYEAALAEVEPLMNAEAGTPDGDRLDILVTLVQAYEAQRYPIEAPDPIALIEFVMEQRGLSRADLAPMIGSRGRVTEILQRRRALTLPMIRRLHADLQLPMEALVGDYALRRHSTKDYAA
jgi:HTH-type transcriptional regulator/antitoxin HigA